MPSCVAAAGERSMMRPLVDGPRSAIRTTTERPLATSVTSTCVPNGSVGCAAVSAPDTGDVPLAVPWPDAAGRYQDAVPVCRHASGAGVGAGFGVAQEANAGSRTQTAHRGCMLRMITDVQGEMIVARLPPAFWLSMAAARYERVCGPILRPTCRTVTGWTSTSGAACS